MRFLWELEEEKGAPGRTFTVVHSKLFVCATTVLLQELEKSLALCSFTSQAVLSTEIIMVGGKSGNRNQEVR